MNFSYAVLASFHLLACERAWAVGVVAEGGMGWWLFLSPPLSLSSIFFLPAFFWPHPGLESLFTGY